MKKTFLAIFFIFLSVLVSADEIQVPFSCWPKELHEEFLKSGRKLDLHSEDRTEDSWGYLVNQGSSFSIYTYAPVTPKDFEVIQMIVMTIQLKKENGLNE